MSEADALAFMLFFACQRFKLKSLLSKTIHANRLTNIHPVLCGANLSYPPDVGRKQYNIQPRHSSFYDGLPTP